jgi:hypothetical protein
MERETRKLSDCSQFASWDFHPPPSEYKYIYMFLVKHYLCANDRSCSVKCHASYTRFQNLILPSIWDIMCRQQISLFRYHCFISELSTPVPDSIDFFLFNQSNSLALYSYFLWHCSVSVNSFLQALEAQKCCLSFEHFRDGVKDRIFRVLN